MADWSLELWSGQVDRGGGPGGLCQLLYHGVAGVGIGFVVEDEIAYLDVAAGGINLRLAEQYGEIEPLLSVRSPQDFEPAVHAVEHGLYIAASAEIRMHANFRYSSDVEPPAFGFDVFVMDADVGDDGPPHANYPAVAVGLAKIPPPAKDIILRLGEARGQKHPDLGVKGIVHIRVRKVFD